MSQIPPLSVLKARYLKRKEYTKHYIRSYKSSKKRAKLRKENKLIKAANATPQRSRYNGNPYKIPKYKKALIKHLMSKQNNKCAYCASDITYKYQIDHIHPRSTGGTNGLANLCLCCPFCNRAKLNLPLPIFLNWLNQINS